MKLHFKENDRLVSAKLQGELIINHVKALYQKCKEGNMLENPKPLIVDLSGVERIDSAGVQLLLFIKKNRRSENLKTSFTAHSMPVLKAFDLLGLVSVMGDKIKLTKAMKEQLSLSYGLKKVTGVL